MDVQVPELNPAWQKRLETAAALAREQLDCAMEIVREVSPDRQDERLVAAVLQAIATNQATLHAP